MSVYLTIVSKTNENLKHKLDALLENNVLEANLHIQHGERKVYFSEKGYACLVSFSLENSVILQGHDQYCQNGSGALALQGNILKQEKEISDLEFLTAKDVMAVLEYQKGDNWFKDNFTGDYSYVRLSKDGEVVATTDTMGFEHLYYGEDDENYYVSNRIRLIKCLHQKTQVDLMAMVYIPYDMNLVGDSTSETGIKRLKQKQTLTIDGLGKMRIEGNELFVLEDVDKGIEDEQQYIRDNVNICINQVNALLHSVDELKFPLTGGRDSRAIFGLLLQSKYKDKISIETEGYEGHSDVIVARDIAKHYNMPYEMITRRRPESFSAGDVFDTLMKHVFRSDGCKGGWDADEFLNYHMIGHASEGFKEWDKAGQYIESTDQLIGESRFVNSKYRYAKPGMISELNGYFDERTKRLAGLGYDYRRILDSYKITDRIPNWHGYFNNLIQSSQGSLMVLNNENLMKFGYTLGGDNRRVMRTHYEIMRQADKWLVEQPFGVSGWNPELAKYITDDTNIFNKPINTLAGRPFYGSWQWKINDSNTIRKMFWELLNSYDNSYFWDYYDKKTVEYDILNRQFDVRDIITIYAVITNYMYYHNIELPEKVTGGLGQREDNIRLQTDDKKYFWLNQSGGELKPENALTIDEQKPKTTKREMKVSKAVGKFAGIDAQYDLSRHGDMRAFLEKADNHNYKIYICGRWGGMHDIPADIVKGIEKLGAQMRYVQGVEGNFIALIDAKTQIMNRAAKGVRLTERMTLDKEKVVFICGGRCGGDEGYIVINDEYFKSHCEGITFVVYDKIVNEVVDYMTYNVNSGYTVRYQDWGWKRLEFMGISEESKVAKEKQELQKNLKKCREEKTNKEMQNEELSKKIEGLNEQNEELEKKSEAIRKQNIALEKQIKHYEESTSLKIGRKVTAIPRSIKAIFKRS